MSIENRKLASRMVSKLLCGMVLDSIRIYSAVIQIGFFRPGSPLNTPTEVWVVASGELLSESVSLEQEQEPEIATETNFFSQRAAVLGELYLLIGKEVVSASVSDSCVLEVEFANKRICAKADTDSLEEIWSVMSDSPDPNKDHRWYVALDDSGRITARSPN